MDSNRQILVLATAASISALTAQTALAGVDSIRGRWNLTVEGLESSETALTLFINNVIGQPESDSFVASGCTKTNDSGALAPLSIQVNPTENGDFDVNIVTSVITEAGDSYTLALSGPVRTLGPGISDDVAGGADSQVQTEFFTGGSWTGSHQNRQRTNCPPAPIPPLEFSADAGEWVEFDGDTVQSRTAYAGGDGTVVAWSLRVITPRSEEYVVPPYTDIFSPEVDFISRFRFVGSLPEEGIPGTYTFDLLDVSGQEIEGTTRTDVFTACPFTRAPSNLLTIIRENGDVELKWDGVGPFPGFNPSNDIGFYDIYTEPSQYGANVMVSTTHVMPWNSFSDDNAGSPDGYDRGVPLSQIDNGFYTLVVAAHAFPAPGDPGNDFECSTTDYANESLCFEKTDDAITFVPCPPQ